MGDFVTRLAARLQLEGGQALAEYSLILALIATVTIIALTALGLAIIDPLDKVAKCKI
ncbi:MAG: Flp family type IVb pilin [Dehalococcoidia bacterium]|nr:MAG: Flp family type IVb pilin [Dehalococcoidia bacterium]